MQTHLSGNPKSIRRHRENGVWLALSQVTEKLLLVNGGRKWYRRKLLITMKSCEIYHAYNRIVSISMNDPEAWSRFSARCRIASFLWSSGFPEHLRDSLIPLLLFISLRLQYLSGRTSNYWSRIQMASTRWYLVKSTDWPGYTSICRTWTWF